MKKKIFWIELLAGVLILLGGVITYWTGINDRLPVPRPDLVIYGTSLVGSLLILCSLEFLGKKTRTQEIAENDERNVAIRNASMAFGFQIMTLLLGLGLFLLIFSGYMNKVSCFGTIAVLLVSRLAVTFYAGYLDKRM